MSEEHPGQTVEVWFQDEARIGQQGTLTRLWAERGTRPTAVKQTEYDWLYVFAAVNPLTGESSALLAPTVNTQMMNGHLRFISEHVGPSRHVVLVLDQAGWHVAKDLEKPANITLLPLPPYSPELNCIERVWQYMRNNYLSNRAYNDYDHLFEETQGAWNRLTEADLRSICHTAWLDQTPAGRV